MDVLSRRKGEMEAERGMSRQLLATNGIHPKQKENLVGLLPSLTGEEDKIIGQSERRLAGSRWLRARPQHTARQSDNVLLGSGDLMPSPLDTGVHLFVLGAAQGSFVRHGWARLQLSLS